MKSLGTDQFEAMKFKPLNIDEEWRPLLGNIVECFSILFFGPSGNGKTETVMRLVKSLAKLDRVDWVEFESGHGADIQSAIKRNGLKGLPITWTDPWEMGRSPEILIEKDKAIITNAPIGRNATGNQMFVELLKKMLRPKSAKYWVLNSADASNFTPDQVVYLMRKFDKKKGIIFIGLSESNRIRRAVTKSVFEFCQSCFFVNNYIAKTTNKNRYGGWGHYVTFEERARMLEPLFFTSVDERQTITKKSKKGKA